MDNEKSGQEIAEQKTEPLSIAAVPAETVRLQNDWKLAGIMSASNLVPRDFKGKVNDVFVAIIMGREVNLNPIQAVQNIAVINGRTCMWGDAVLGLVRGSGKLEYITEELTGEGETLTATCKVKRIDEPELVRYFSWEDATRANLTRKAGTWQNYPKRMMQMRARGFALRDGFADILKGIAVHEEVEDYKEINEMPDLMPKRKSEKKIEPAHTHTAPVVPVEEIEDQTVITEAQLKRLFAIANEHGLKDKDEIKIYITATYGFKSFKDIKRNDYESICDWITHYNQERKS